MPLHAPFTRRLGPACLAALALAAACGDGSRAGRGEPSLTRTRPEPSCAHGGLRIETGLDADEDGQLDENEVVPAATQVECNAPPAQTLARSEVLDEDEAQCPAGGIATHQGRDTDGNGELDDEEIERTDVTCNPRTLVRVTLVPEESEECAHQGGQLHEAGHDDGEGDGEPLDGVLSDDEVDSAYLDCNVAIPNPNEAIEPPDGPPGSATIDLSGGHAPVGLTGGKGGAFASAAQGENACVAETTRIFPSGALDASFAMPEVAEDFGVHPLVVSGHLLIAARPPSPAEGDLFYDPSFAERGGRLVHIDGGSEREITGLSVTADAQLELPSGAALAFERNVQVAGRVLVSGAAESALALEAQNLVVTPTGRLEAPQHAPAQALLLHARDTLLMAGTLRAAGEGAGASGAHVTLRGGAEIVLAGSIELSGSDGEREGGAGGTLRTSAGTARVFSSASIVARGGRGAVVGGAGGSIVLGGHPSEPNAQALELRHTGMVDVSGGAQDGPCAAEACAGGAGGQVALIAVGRSLLSGGELRADGGTSHTLGGQGGSISLRMLAPALGESELKARLSSAGSVLARGGAGEGLLARAGDGGSLTLQHCSRGQSATDFLGYRAIALSGGDASDSTGSGGDAGRFALHTSDALAEARRVYLYVPVTARGGDGASGGSGGSLALELGEAQAVPKHALPSWLPAVIVAGDHVLDGGGAGVHTGGPAGHVSLSVRGSLHVLDSMSARGGTGVPGTRGGTIEAVSSNELLLTGGLTVDGSASSSDGGPGGCIVLEGRTLELTGSAAARGGQGGESASGGPGGTIRYVSRDEPAAVSGALDVSGGAGAIMGAVGTASSDVDSCAQ